MPPKCTKMVRLDINICLGIRLLQGTLVLPVSKISKSVLEPFGVDGFLSHCVYYQRRIFID